MIQNHPYIRDVQVHLLISVLVGIELSLILLRIMLTHNYVLMAQWQNPLFMLMGMKQGDGLLVIMLLTLILHHN